MKTFIAIASFLAGLSLGAILSWADDNYRSKAGIVWVFYFAFFSALSFVSILIL